MRKRRKTVAVTFDGVEYEAFSDESVMDASRRLGLEIPSLCYLEGLSVWGGCRMCVVQIAEDHRLRPACATPVAPDMEIKTDTPQIKAHRKTITELLFAEGNHVCAVCVVNGNCELQDVAVVNEMDHVRFDYQSPLREIDASHPKYIFDPNRCILCTRCVRVCHEIEGAHVWDIAYRGAEAMLVTEMNKPWGESMSCTWCGKCVAVCPTGSLAYQGRAVGEMQHQTDIVIRLATARNKGEWIDPSELGEVR
jgi:bidirectional [NiFe] hydrogenase diaphorase subunit